MPISWLTKVLWTNQGKTILENIEKRICRRQLQSSDCEEAFEHWTWLLRNKKQGNRPLRQTWRSCYLMACPHPQSSWRRATSRTSTYVKTTGPLTTSARLLTTAASTGPIISRGMECFWLEDPLTIMNKLCTVYVTMWKYIILVQFQLHVHLFCSRLWWFYLFY